MTLTRTGNEIAAYFAEAMALSLSDDVVEEGVCEVDGRPLRARFNLAPSQDVLTFVPAPKGSGATAEYAWKQWGLVPSWAKDPMGGAPLFNARSETVDTKPSFRAAFKRRRCLIVADGFYEWTPKNRDHRPFHFSAAGGMLLAFAGLFEEWSGEGGEVIESCTVLTTEANADLEGVHHRMPVILDPDRFGTWLEPQAEPLVLKALLVPSPAGTLRRRAVSRYVNDPRRDDPRCLEPEPEAAQADLFRLDGKSSGGLGA
jgi:putative SOS response-associated peptidase YedK